MKKKIILVAILIISILTVATACNNTQGYIHKHILILHEAKEATCALSGNDTYYECKKCHKLFLDEKGENPTDNETVNKEKLAHSPKAVWSYDESGHYHRCEVCDEKIYENVEAHYLGEDSVCDICGYRRPSSSLLYELDKYGGFYSLVGIGECSDVEIVIPSTYLNIRVLKIKDNVFKDCDNIQRIIMGDGITSIDDDVFMGCTNLQSIMLSDSITRIGKNAFYECANLQSITLPDSLTSIEDDAFLGCSSLKNIIIGNKIESIGKNAFYECTSLQNITLSGRLMSIGYYAFDGCNKLQNVYYLGSAEGWEKVEIENGNSNLISATIFYYSASDPKSGKDYNAEYNYWHYDESGEIAVWDK